MPAPYQNPAMASYPTPSPQDVDTGLVCLLILAWYFGLVADGEQLRHEFGLSGKPCGDTEVLRIARRLKPLLRRPASVPGARRDAHAS